MEVFPSLLQRVSVPGRGWLGHNQALFQGTVGGEHNQLATTFWCARPPWRSPGIF